MDPRQDNKFLSCLLFNRRLESAIAYASPLLSFDVELLSAFESGSRERFFSIFSLLSRNTHLEFYLHVYFFVYPIHPAINPAPSPLTKEEIKYFKLYLDTRGAELAQVTEFLEYFSLPFVKKPLQHPAFKSIFKKQWIESLRDSLIEFIKEENRRIRESSQSLFTRSSDSLEPHFNEQSNQRNQQLQSQLERYIQKYKRLESQCRNIAEGARSSLLESQSKWFQITKELVQCSKSLITLISQNNRQLTSERKFLNIKKKIDRYEKFVSKKLEDMISHSQDLSIFDRPSINELSCTILPYTQKSKMLHLY